jgi:NAD(P)-dependent dehydrogenase (short-subunit alcohol dehydrogenase family)
MELEGRVAIVTGSGGGLGKAIAISFAEERANVLISDINIRNMKNVVAEIRKAGYTALGVRCDVTKPREVQRMVSTCIKKFGQVDILVNNAGGEGADMGNRFLEGIPFKDWQRTIDVNLKGTIHCTMAVMPYMIEKKYGKIINISSQAGRYTSEMAGPYYAAAKAGQLGFTRQMALRLGPYGIYVNAIAPGLILSGPRVEGIWLERGEEQRQEMVSKIPLRRLGNPEEIASVVKFLASDASSYITGTTIDVNGGRFMS